VVQTNKQKQPKHQRTLNQTNKTNNSMQLLFVSHVSACNLANKQVDLLASGDHQPCKQTNKQTNKQTTRLVFAPDSEEQRTDMSNWTSKRV
jgi:hypothetical protein